jgi:glutathione synthase/RimK-type ligase-like ATP-grasp enzyme
VRNAYVTLVVGLASHEKVRWLTSFDRLLLADNKLVQGRIAAALGLSFPQTVVCSRPRDVPQGLGQQLVIKPLGPSSFATASGQRVVFAQHVNRAEIEGLPLAGAPFLVQELIPAEEHLRVVTVNNQCWIAGLDAEKVPLDWRSDERSHRAFTPRENKDVATSAVAVAQNLGLGYSSQDWAVVDSRAWLLDVNPAGQWLFLPTSIGESVTDAIANWLLGNDDSE